MKKRNLNIIMYIVTSIIFIAVIEYIYNNYIVEKSIGDNELYHENESQTINETSTEKEYTESNNIYHQPNTKVVIYEFYGNGCPHCESLNKFFDELSKDEKYKDKFEVKKYEVWNNKNNEKLMNEILNKFYEGKTSEGVPTYFIGDILIIGYDEYMKIEIKEKIDKQYETSYIDYVETINEPIK